MVSTRAGRERRLAQDLCDCGFHQYADIRCEAVAPGLFYVEAPREVVETCLSMVYFSRLVGRVEYYDYVTAERPTCGGCTARQIGRLFFVRVL